MLQISRVITFTTVLSLINLHTSKVAKHGIFCLSMCLYVNTITDNTYQKLMQLDVMCVFRINYRLDFDFTAHANTSRVILQSK